MPGTEVAVNAAHVFDVTEPATKPALSGSQPHWWPIDAYLTLEPGFSTSLEVTGSFDAAALRERFPAGQRQAVE
ncbi:MAG: hypothetical protein JNJ54_15230 [Myxococcaceae bacterium]|nr:hypothetical protein [Myxococcaceae bacterium]